MPNSEIVWSPEKNNQNELMRMINKGRVDFIRERGQLTIKWNNGRTMC